MRYWLMMRFAKYEDYFYRFKLIQFYKKVTYCFIGKYLENILLYLE